MSSETNEPLFVVFHQACKHAVCVAKESLARSTRRELGMWASVREATDDDIAFLMNPGSAMKCRSCVALLHAAAFAYARATTGHVDAKVLTPQFAPDGSFAHLSMVSEDGTVETL